MNRVGFFCYVSFWLWVVGGERMFLVEDNFWVVGVVGSFLIGDIYRSWGMGEFRRVLIYYMISGYWFLISSFILFCFLFYFAFYFLRI